MTSENRWAKHARESYGADWSELTAGTRTVNAQPVEPETVWLLRSEFHMGSPACDGYEIAADGSRWYKVDVEALGEFKPLEAKQSSNVDHPVHYTKHASGVEAITITEQFNFNLGNAIKYIWRAGSKGEALEDLEKASWYVQREIKRLNVLASASVTTNPNSEA